MTVEPRAPTPEGLNAEFYEQAAGGVLHLQQCTECLRLRHVPRYLCPACFSGSYQWTPSPGRGRLYSWTVTHFPYDRGWAAGLPYATVVVELDEGVRVIGSFDGQAESLQVGREVVLSVDTKTYGFPFLRFSRP